MTARKRAVNQSSILLSALCFALLSASGQTKSYSFGPNLGTFAYTAQSFIRSCASNYGPASYTQWVYSGFSYSNPQAGISQPISGSTVYNEIGGRAATGACPNYRAGDPVIYTGSSNGEGYTITIYPLTSGNASATISVPGYVNPKYIVLGVMYAPPGSTSSVTYASNTVVGNSASTSSSFSDQVTKTISVSFGESIFGFSIGQTSTSSTSNTQEQDSSFSIAISQSTSKSSGLNGFSDPNKGINHDYDYIFVFLNPVAQFTVVNGGGADNMNWNGYGYDLNDKSDYPDMDVVGIQLGCLNSDFYNAYQSNPSVNTAWLTCEDIFNNNFSRSWALNNTDGSSPALTPTLANSTAPYDFCQQQGTDLYNVCQVDPFSNPNYTLTFPSGSITTTDGRYTACSNSLCNATIDYEPNVNNSYSQGYSTTAAQSQGAKHVYSTSYSVENQFKTSGWLLALSRDLTNTNTMTWTNQFSVSTNNSKGQAASFTIMGPAEGYTGPTQFVVYQDNLYGTFMFFPGN